MIINRLDIISFGKFKNKTIEFNNGLNIISGANESGKSTVAAFIYAMLYGFGDNRGKGISFRERYKPWSGGETEGSLTLTLKSGKAYTIYRKMGASKKYDVLTIYDALTGKKEEIPPEALTDTDSETFLKTLFIKQNNSVFSGTTEELSSRLSNLSLGGDEEYNVKNALEILGDMKKEILSVRGSGELGELKMKIEKLTLKEEQLSSLKSEISLLEQDIIKSQKEESMLKKRCDEISSEIELEYGKVAGTKEHKNSFTLQLGVFSAFISFIFLFLSQKSGIAFLLPFILFLIISAAGFYRHIKSNGKSEISADKLKRLNYDYKTVQEKYAEVKAETSKLSQRLEILKSTDFAENKSELERLLTREKELENFFGAVKLSESALLSVYDSLVSGFIPALNKKASEYFNEITLGKYTTLLSDSEFSLSVNLSEPKESALFSGGTTDQMYFSLRLSLIDLLFGSDSVCMVIDQPFMQYDAERKNKALEILTRLSKIRQIILFTAEEDNISKLKSTEILT